MGGVVEIMDEDGQAISGMSEWVSGWVGGWVGGMAIHLILPRSFCICGP